MAISINEIKSGLTLLIDGDVYQVIEYQHVKPGKGAAFVRVKVKNLKTAAVLEKTFRGVDKIEEAYIEERKLRYLYPAGDILHFMDQDNFEEVAISSEVLGNKAKFLKDNLDVSAFFYKNDVVNVNLPTFVEYKITHTEPGIKGDTAKSGTKPAEIESGATVQVPLFVDKSDTIKVDTRTGEYVERVY